LENFVPKYNLTLVDNLISIHIQKL